MFKALTQEVVLLAAGARTTTATSDPVNLPPGVLAITFISDQNTVSGTSPTLDVSIEIGVNIGGSDVWFGIARLTQQTSATELFHTVPFAGLPSLGIAHASSVFTGMSGAELAATGGSATAACVVPPRKLRVVATIGGTNPSFNGSVVALIQSVK